MGGCCQSKVDDDSDVIVTKKDSKVTVLWYGDQTFEPCLNESFERVRSTFRGSKSKVKIGKWGGAESVTEHTMAVVVVVPQITRLGIDVDRALDEIRPKISASNQISIVVLVLHNQAPHIDEVYPSDQQLTDEKYKDLGAILDLQIYEGERRHTQSNDKTIKRIARILEEQQAKTSPERPLMP